MSTSLNEFKLFHIILKTKKLDKIRKVRFKKTNINLQQKQMCINNLKMVELLLKLKLTQNVKKRNFERIILFVTFFYCKTKYIFLKL